MITSLDVDDQHRLVEAILRIDTMRVRRSRDLFLDALERDLGHRLHFVRHDRDRLDVWALVDAWLDYPGAAHASVRILGRIQPGSNSVRALDALVCELLPDPWLDQAERRELHRLIARLDQASPDPSPLARFPMLYRRAVGPAWPLLDREIHSLHDVVALLEEIPAGADGVPPLLVFVNDLAAYAGEAPPPFHNWVDRQLRELGLDGRLLRLHAERQAAPDAPDTYLVVECAPDALEPDRYLLTAWLQVDGAPGTMLACEDDAVPLHRIPELLERLLMADSAVVGRPNPDLIVEFVLPRSLLDYPVEQLKVNIAGFEPRLGIWCPVVVRSLDRMRLAALHHGWRHRWKRLRGNPREAPALLVHRPGEYGQEELFSKLGEELPVALALAFPPWGGQSGEPDEHWVGLLAGVPVIAWCRDGRDPARFAREMRDLLAADLLTLPRRTMQLRRRALAAGAEGSRDHLGQHLALLFDDADRIPEPYVRLRPPA